MEVTASWKPGFQSLYKSIDPQKVAEEIMEIGESVTPKQILEKGKDPTTELHKCFEWDDSEAAERYRIIQARRVVQFLVIRESVTEEVGTPIRLLYKAGDSEGYKPTTIILQNKDEYKALLRRALAELVAFQTKYKTLSELEGIFEEIEKLMT